MSAFHFRAAIFGCAVAVIISCQSASSFSTNFHPHRYQLARSSPKSRHQSASINTFAQKNENGFNHHVLGKAVSDVVTKSSLIALISASIILTPMASLADEIGKEVEAPTLFTGESVEICVKRGPLGACTKTELRTVSNDNDKAEKYFAGKEKSIRDSVVTKTDDGEDSEILRRLRQKTEENREKNEQAVMIKTFENNQAANFGPFDRQVLIMNTDGRTFTLLQNPQAMRLKKAGYIEGRKFVTQPSKEVIDNALESENEFGNFIKGLIPGSD